MSFFDSLSGLDTLVTELVIELDVIFDLSCLKHLLVLLSLLLRTGSPVQVVDLAV